MSDRSADYLDGMRDGMTYRSERIEKLEAEIERLRAANEQLKDRIDEHHRIFEPMRADNERLRAALLVIANHTETDILGDVWISRPAMVARRALAGEEKA